ncbi:MAG: hypothetical protein M1827_005801 [Pycnora praestabilis]|nr:MAG: hypothetical protein M1827_005801 [Pycnora praestabilis]
MSHTKQGSGDLFRKTLYNLAILSAGTIHRFIPSTPDLKSALSPESIFINLEQCDSIRNRKLTDLANNVSEKASKLFAALAHSGTLFHLESLINEGLTDEDLPVKLSNNVLTCSNNSSKSFPTGDWEEWDLNSFLNSQWCFLAPIFNSRNQELKLEYGHVLPFIDRVALGEGSYSDVYKVQIHEAHQKFPDMKEGQPVALKVFKHRDTKNVDFERETAMFKELKVIRHPHIIKLLATIEQKSIGEEDLTYSMMFPLAKSNLRQYWEKEGSNVSKDLTPSLVLWVLHQFQGLAGGLHEIHNLKSSSTPSANLAVNEEVINGRHGDIKPENILFFYEPTEEHHHGILRIADFGLGKFHNKKASGVTSNKSIPRARSGTYEAPECMESNQMSRPYDIWTLGCVYLEFTIWLIFRSTGLQSFGTDRLNSSGITNVKTDQFYNIQQNGQSVLREAVEIWVDALLEAEICKGAIVDLVHLIREQMLEVLPKKRIKSEELVKKLSDIVERAELDAQYLLNGMGRPAVPAFKCQRQSSTFPMDLRPDMSRLPHRSGIALSSHNKNTQDHAYAGFQSEDYAYAGSHPKPRMCLELEESQFAPPINQSNLPLPAINVEEPAQGSDSKQRTTQNPAKVNHINKKSRMS